MDQPLRVERRLLRVGGLTRSDLKQALFLAGVRLNGSGETLLADPIFENTDAETVATIEITQCSVRDLGLNSGATLPQILATARKQGLLPCPPFTGPYLRLATPDQPTAPDSVMHSGRAPTGSVTVASERLRVEDDYPRGFYLRVVEGQLWLRGFRCTDDAGWFSEDRFTFRL